MSGTRGNRPVRITDLAMLTTLWTLTYMTTMVSMTQPAYGEVNRLQFQASLVVRNEKQLAVRYTVHNGNPFPIYLFNQLYQDIDQKTGIYLTDRKLVSVDIDNGRLLISKKIPPVPPGKSVELPYVPGLTKVLPNQTFTEEFDLELPLHTKNPYDGWLDPKSYTQLTTQSVIVFEVGYFFAQNGADVDHMLKTVKTPTGDMLFAYPFTPSRQKTVRQLIQDVTIKVWDTK